jgi:hypothetical protein
VLFIGNIKDFIFCSCLKNKEIISKGNITKAFIKRRRFLATEYDLTQTLNKSKLKSLLEKLSHIKTLYSNECIINAETIQTLFDCCHRLQCIGFYNICSYNNLNEWQQIVKKMSNKVIEFSTNNLLFFRENDGNIILYPIEEFVKYLKSLKELKIFRYIDNEEELFRNLPKTIRHFYINRGRIDNNSINLLIESNHKEISILLFERIFINEEMFEKICKNYNLEKFSFSCRTLSLRKLSEMAKFQTDLKFLKIFWCEISYKGIDSLIRFTKVRILKLIACLLKPKVMESIGKLFLNLKRLDLSYCKTVCECNQEIHHNYRCIECHQKFIDILSKMMIKVLHLHYSDVSQALIHSLKNFKVLQTIRVNGLLEEMTALEANRLTQLLETFIEISKRESKKLFTIEVNKITTFADNILMPRNFRLSEFFSFE